MGWLRNTFDRLTRELTQQGLPSYLTLNPGGTISFNEGTTNRQVVDTLYKLGTITEDDYNWFNSWFSEAANQGTDVANQTNFLSNAGNLDFSNTNFNDENKARVNKIARFMNNTYAEEGAFFPSSTFSQSYGYSATTPKVGVFNRAGGTREVSGGALLSAMPSEAAQYNAMLDVLVPQQESAGLGVFVDPSNLPLYSSNEKQYQDVPPRDLAPMLPPDDTNTFDGGGGGTDGGTDGGGGGGGTDTGPGGPNNNPNRVISKDSPYHGAMFSQGGIVSLSENMDMTPTGGGIESMLMTYESPDYAARERSAATLRRNLEKIASRPTAQGPVPTMQQGIMPMAR